MKFNRLNVYLGNDGAFEVDAYFDTTNIDKAYRCCVDINEDFIYISGKFNQQMTIPVAESQPDLTVDNHDETVILSN